MTPQEQNIAIAEACGKQVCRHKPDKWEYRGPEGDSELYCPECKKYLHDMRYPSYTTSLDACREMEKVLTDNQHREFRSHLWRITDNRDLEFTDTNARQYVSSTAAQRCEAFLRTIGKFVENPPLPIAGAARSDGPTGEKSSP